jgi:microcystin-dependent protein
MANAALLATLGDQTSSQAAGAIAQLMPSGVILPFGGGTAPTGWLLCDGSAISRTTYANLFAAIGTAHGYGDNSTTFNLPDFRGRFMRGVDGTANRDPDKGTRTSAATGGNTGNNVGSAQTNATAKNGLSATAGSSSVSGTTNIGHSHGASSVTGSTDSSGNHGHTGGTIILNGLILGFGNNPVNDGGGSGVYSPPVSYGSSQLGNRVDTYGSSNHSHGSSYTAGGQSLGTSNISLASGTAAAQTVTVGNGDNETRPLNINVHYIIKV